jgi:hypothetical protein
MVNLSDYCVSKIFTSILTPSSMKTIIARLRLPTILLGVICLANSTALFSQSSDFIDGKVINSTTHKPVPFATIKLKYNQLGIYANADGDFKISSNPEFQDDSLMITCIGFKQSSLAYKDLRDQVVNKVLLTPVVYGLAEVKVVASRKKLNSIVIIRRAIRKIPDNYPDKPFNFISYYRDYQKRNGNYINLNEAIVQTLDSGFTSESVTNRYRLLDFRENMDFPRVNISPYYDTHDTLDLNNTNKVIPDAILGDQYGNELFILAVHDAIRNFNTRSFSFIETFSKDFILNHSFSEPVTVLNNNLLLYRIDFKSRSRITGDKLQASGAIYIQPRDYSIHKLEYSCFYKINGEGSKEMFNIDVEYGYGNDIDPRLYLKYITFNNFFKVVDRVDTTYFRVLSSKWDSQTNIKPTVILNFNNNIDPETASKKNNYEVRIGKKTIKINSIQVVGKNLYIRFKADDIKGKRDSCKVSINNIEDIDGNILGKKKSIALYQYRELFVQENNRPLPFIDSCYMQFLPLEQNCISKFAGKDKYWMNTPENIKNNK